ncbi:hypothetical protein HZC21_06360 [Candidatus Peregrinibacteria bacterium]|nr:hypothetical protein [Candidatus Peregrinibacteria bacterium]
MSNKIIKEFLIIMPVMMIALAVGNLYQASAQSLLPIPPQLCGEGGFPCPEGTKAEEMAKSLAGKVIDNVRYIVGAVAIFMIIISGIKLVMNSGDEEVFKKQVTNIFYGIIGLFLIMLAGDIASIFEVDRGGFLKDPNVTVQKSRLFSRTVEIIITFIKYIIGGVAVLFTARNGLRLVLLGGNEEEAAKDKKNLYYSAIGLIVILIANTVVNKVFFKIDTSQYPGIEPVRPGVDPKAFAKEVAGMTNLVAAITGPIALLSLVAGGLMYILAGGEDEKINKAKKVITWSLIGIIIIYGAFAIVSTFVAGKFEGL